MSVLKLDEDFKLRYRRNFLFTLQIWSSKMNDNYLLFHLFLATFFPSLSTYILFTLPPVNLKSVRRELWHVDFLNYWTFIRLMGDRPRKQNHRYFALGIRTHTHHLSWCGKGSKGQKQWRQSCLPLNTPSAAIGFLLSSRTHCFKETNKQQEQQKQTTRYIHTNTQIHKVN